MKCRLAVVALFLVVGPASAQQKEKLSTDTYDCVDRACALLAAFGGVIDGNRQFSSMGGLGQTFRLNANVRTLESFSIRTAGWDSCRLDIFGTPASPGICDILFRTYIVGWDPNLNSATSVVWSSNVMSLDPRDDYGQALGPIVAHPMIPITAGIYAALLLPVSSGPDVVDDFAGELTGIVYYNDGTQLRPSPYSDGYMIGWGGSPTDNVLTGWHEWTDSDLAFEADLTVTPEPAMLLLLASGLLALGAAARRRRSDRGSE